MTNTVKSKSLRVVGNRSDDSVSVYRYYVLGILTLTYTLNFLDRQIIGILAVPLKEEFQLSDSQFGLLGGLAFALLYSTLAVPIAWFADRFSRVWIITGALTLWSGFTALCGLAGSFTQLFMCRMGVGIGEAGGVAPAYSLISDYFPKRQRGRAFAFFSLGFPFGAASGTLLGGLVAANFGWRSAFMIVGLMGVFVAPLVRFTIREPERGSLDYPQASDSFTSSDQRREYASDILGVLKFLLGKPSFWLLSFGAASASVCGYGLAAWLPSFFVRSFGLSLSETAGYYAGITFLGGVVGIWCGGQIADKLGLLARSAYPLVPAVAFVISVPCFILAMNIQGILYSLFANLEHADWGGFLSLLLCFSCRQH